MTYMASQYKWGEGPSLLTRERRVYQGKVGPALAATLGHLWIMTAVITPAQMPQGALDREV